MKARISVIKSWEPRILDYVRTHSGGKYFREKMIDTLTIARDLEDSGVVWEQAQAHAKVIANAVEKQHQDLATKEFVRSEVSGLRGEMKDLETRLVRWIVATTFAVGGILFTALRFSIG